MDLGQHLLISVVAAGLGWTVGKALNALEGRSTAVGNGEYVSTFNMSEFWDRL